jgi:DNA-binding XRE family transcriptional regulator
MNIVMPPPADVRAARDEIGWTQARCARLLGVTESAWRKWETHWTSDEYRQISWAHWELFIRKTDSLRPKDSRFKLRNLPS